MDHSTHDALARSQLIDMTTTGRKTGQPRRIEIGLHSIDGRLYISGMPRADHKRAWILNLERDPRVTLSLKQTAHVEVPATARIIEDPVERRQVLELIAVRWGRTDVDVMAAHSPLIEVMVAGYPRGEGSDHADRAA
ncbi:MAG TPA: nitroreductase/quinone reductase family protein [Candidatus Limnocylindrales bacterium]|jgi:deazaflavin-dependent oxidoreductase (nitroreductase family)